MKFTHPSGSRPLDGYTIKRGVGRGGFGEVYFAESDAGKEVALKLIRRNLDVELRGVRHCLNLKHPNLIGLYDIKTDDMDDRWVVMEFVSGESLEEAIDRHPGGMSKEDVLRWMYGIAAGVAYLHDHGIVHRDLKPGNIFTDDGVVKIGDYGLAKFISCSRRSGQTESVGTIHYMAPEIANGRYGREIDTYALGVTLYEMLTGAVPFEGESVGEVLMKHLTAEPDLGALDEPYRSIVARCLAKDPEKRLGSVAELIEMLPAPPPGTYSEPIRVSPPTPGAAAASAARAGASQEAVPEAIVLEEAPEVVNAVAIEEEDGEPIARAIGDGWRNVQSWWNELEVNAGVKSILLVLVILGLLFSAGFWAPILVIGAVIYCVYYVVWSIITPPKPSRRVARRDHDAVAGARAGAAAVRGAAAGDAGAAVHQAAAWQAGAASSARARLRANRKEHRHWRRTTWYDPSRDMLGHKSVREKITELTGSMLLATVVAATMSLIVSVLCSVELTAARMVWMMLSGTLGAWLLMIPAKVWEGRRGDDGARRFAMLVVGLLIGASLWALASVLMIDLPNNPDFPSKYRVLSRGLLQNNLYSADGSPLLLAYCAYFGFLFVILRWWRKADPLRITRLSLWSTIWCVACAWLLTFFWWFPQPWGIMLATVISVSVQLASPWVPPEERGLQGEE